MNRDVDRTTPLGEKIWVGKEQFRTSAYAIQVDGQWFAGFGGRPGGEKETKFRAGLCDAKLISGSNRQKVDEYLKRLADKGYSGTPVLVSIPSL